MSRCIASHAGASIVARSWSFRRAPWRRNSRASFSCRKMARPTSHGWAFVLRSGKISRATAARLSASSCVPSSSRTLISSAGGTMTNGIGAVAASAFAAASSAAAACRPPPLRPHLASLGGVLLALRLGLPGVRGFLGLLLLEGLAALLAHLLEAAADEAVERVGEEPAGLDRPAEHDLLHHADDLPGALGGFQDLGEGVVRLLDGADRGDRGGHRG